MTDIRRGRLRDPALAPTAGERHEVVVEISSVRVEQILSGRLDGPEAFVGEAHEWVVVLAGGARLELGDEVVALTPGDWVLIPAGQHHVLHETEPGTQWLAVHVPAAAGSPVIR